MSQTIPASPLLALGEIIDKGLVDKLIVLSESQKPLKLSETRLENLFFSKDKFQATLQQAELK